MFFMKTSKNNEIQIKYEDPRIRKVNDGYQPSQERGYQPSLTKSVQSDKPPSGGSSAQSSSDND